MIILDTNVVSALMRRDANPAVVGWLDDQPVESVWITAVTVFEVHFGLELMTNGSKRPLLQDEFARALDEDFEGRILPFDRSAAREAELIAARQRQERRSIDIRDAQIAGIAPPAARRWRPATPGTSPTSASRSSIRAAG